MERKTIWNIHAKKPLNSNKDCYAAILKLQYGETPNEMQLSCSILQSKDEIYDLFFQSINVYDNDDVESNTHRN